MATFERFMSSVGVAGFGLTDREEGFTEEADLHLVDFSLFMGFGDKKKNVK